MLTVWKWVFLSTNLHWDQRFRECMKRLFIVRLNFPLMTWIPCEFRNVFFLCLTDSGPSVDIFPQHDLFLPPFTRRKRTSSNIWLFSLVRVCVCITVHTLCMYKSAQRHSWNMHDFRNFSKQWHCTSVCCQNVDRFLLRPKLYRLFEIQETNNDKIPIVIFRPWNETWWCSWVLESFDLQCDGNDRH